ncbi:MAG: Phosphoadenosine phosphosulfate reductase [Pseudomonadota bacterium]|jgi:phosphoadenosine phosphosulfate reductase
MNPSEFHQLQQQLYQQSPKRILKTALEYSENIAISFSGAEDVVLIDMAIKIKPDIQVFTLDTGRLHPQTYRFIEQVRQHYQLKIRCLTPDCRALEQFVTEKGLFSFYKEGHQECCHLRKVEPLQRQLATLNAWITGQRQDQSIDTRQDLTEVEIDTKFSTEGKILLKFNPLCRWNSSQVWDYIEAHQVPYNELHQQGFISIGCEPCTRPILPNQHERSGRWWWEEGQKECGLHASNLTRFSAK